MSPEDLERTMNFILQHQAQFAANIDKLFESEAKLIESNERLRESDERLRESDERQRESQATLTASLLRIAELIENLTEAQKVTDGRFKLTDERLNALINVVERHITGPDHGGKPQ